MASASDCSGDGCPTSWPLEAVDFARLRSRDPAEMEKLLLNARAPGAFYLDLRNDEHGSSTLQGAGVAYAVAQRYFEQLPAWKLEDVRADQKASQDRGYKQCDGDESFEISRDEQVKGRPLQPAVFDEERAALDDFSTACHEICLTILARLSESLDAGEGFLEHHRRGEPSDSGLKFIYEPWRHRVDQVVDNTHTDSGTLTLLFYEEMGLEAEVQPGDGSDQRRWAFVPPKQGCAIVNVADSLERMSGGALRSLLHRVTQPADGFRKRYYISYFLRPEDAWKDSVAA